MDELSSPKLNDDSYKNLFSFRHNSIFNNSLTNKNHSPRSNSLDLKNKEFFNESKSIIKQRRLSKEDTILKNYISQIKDNFKKERKSKKSNTQTLLNQHQFSFNLKSPLRKNIKSNTSVNFQSEVISSVIKKINQRKENLTAKDEISNFQINNEINNNDDLDKLKTDLTKKENRIIYQFNNLADSIIDSEEEGLPISNKYNPNAYLFSSSSFFLKFWSQLIFIIIIYSAISDPILQTFYENSILLYISIFNDALLSLDVLFNFFIPYYDQEEDLIYDNKLILINYLLSWFSLDVFVSLPFLLISILHIVYIDIFVNPLYEIIYRSFKFIKVLRLIKLFKENEYQYSFDYSLSSMCYIESLQLNRLFIFVVLFLIIIHVSACLWVFISKTGEVNQCMADNNWIIRFKIQDHSMFDIYIASMYFIMCTFTTVGYGDIKSKCLIERVVNIILLLFGGVFFSFLLSFLSNYLLSLDGSSYIIQTKMIVVNEINQMYKIPNELYNKILKEINITFKNGNSEIFQFINTLPSALKTEIIITIHKNHISKMNFFKDQTYDFIIYVLPLLKPHCIMKDEIIISIGELVEEVLFILKGVLSINLGVLLDYIEIAKVYPNCHIGDVLLYLREPSPYELKCASKSCDLLILKRLDYFTIKSNFNQNILQVLEVSKRQIELLETKRALILELRKTESSIENITKKVKRLSLILFRNEFNDYFNNDTNFTELDEFIAEVDIDVIKELIEDDEQEERYTNRNKRVPSSSSIMNKIQRDASKENTIMNFNDEINQENIKLNSAGSIVKDILSLHKNNTVIEKSIERAGTTKNFVKRKTLLGLDMNKIENEFFQQTIKEDDNKNIIKTIERKLTAMKNSIKVKTIKVKPNPKSQTNLAKIDYNSLIELQNKKKQENLEINNLKINTDKIERLYSLLKNTIIK